MQKVTRKEPGTRTGLCRHLMNGKANWIDLARKNEAKCKIKRTRCSSLERSGRDEPSASHRGQAISSSGWEHHVPETHPEI